MSRRLQRAPQWRRRRLAIKDGLMSDDRDHTVATATAMVMYAERKGWPLAGVDVTAEPPSGHQEPDQRQ